MSAHAGAQALLSKLGGKPVKVGEPQASQPVPAANTNATPVPDFYAAASPAVQAWAMARAARTKR